MGDNNLFDLAATIEANFGPADRGLTQNQAKVLNLTKEYEKLDSTARKTANNLAASMSRANAGNKLNLAPAFGSNDKLKQLIAEQSAWSAKMKSDLDVLGSKTAALKNGTVEAGGAMLSAGGSSMIMAGGILVAVGATVALTKGLFDLAQNAADYAEGMSKAEVSSGLGQRALAGLRVISDETGDSWQGLISLSTKLQTSISKGISEPTSEAGRAMKFLGLANEEFKKSSPEQQLQKTAQALQSVTNQADKNRASQVLLGRGWTESADGIVDIANSFDEAQKKAEAFGLVLTEQDIKAAHDFEIAVKDLWIRFEGFGLKVGGQILPQVEGAINDLTDAIFGVDGALAGNESKWDKWSRLANGTIATVRLGLSGIVAALANPNSFGAIVGVAAGNKAVQIAGELDQDKDRAFVGASVPSFGRTFPGGGGRGGGRKSTIDAVTAAIRAQELEIAEATNRSDKWQKVIDALNSSLSAQGKHLSEGQRLTLESNAATLRAIDLEKEKQKTLTSVRERVAEWLQSLNDAREGTDKYDQKLREFRESLSKVGQTFDADTEKRIAFNVMLARTNDYLSNFDELLVAVASDFPQMTEAAEKAFDPFQHLSEALKRTNEQLAEQAAALSVGKRITDLVGAPPPIEDMPAFKRLEFRDKVEPQLRELSQNITRMLSDSIRTGFEQGAGAGFKSMLIGFAEMMIQMAEQWLASAIFQLLTSVLGGGLGGPASSIVSKLGRIGSHASGLDYVPFDNYPALLHKGERVMTAAENRGFGSGGDVHVHMTVYAKDAQSFGSRETQRQIKEKVGKVFQPSGLDG